MAAIYVLRQKLRKQDERKSRMRHVLKTHVSLGNNAFSSSGNGKDKSDSKSNNTKVIPSLPSDSSVDQALEANKDKDDDTPNGLESDDSRRSNALNRLTLRRQKTEQIAKINKQHAENADWL